MPERPNGAAQTCGRTERGRTKRRRVTRWLALSLGFGAAALAIWALASRRPAPPLDDIDAASRAQLEQVLRQADAEKASPP